MKKRVLKKNFLEEIKKKQIYKDFLETFPDAELMDVKNVRRDNDWFFKYLK